MDSGRNMVSDFDIKAYAYELPQENIAQAPAPDRDASRLLVLDRTTGKTGHRRFPDILEYLAPGDLLVVNDTRVFPARLIGRKETGGRVELFLLEYPRPLSEPGRLAGWGSETPPWSQAAAMGLIKSSKRPKPGARLLFGRDLEGTVVSFLASGKAEIRLRFQGELSELLASHGRVPLPPYIDRKCGDESWDRERYQTLFATRTGAVAAPTAGLHFSDPLLAAIRAKGVGLASITLHVGYGTFAPVRVQDIRDHRIHREYVSVSEETAARINAAKAAGGRIWAVGTTTVRALESAVAEDGTVRELSGWCGLYIYPGYRFRVIDNLITNFHLPGSSLLFLVSALVGRERLLHSYQEATDRNYRFYSYGDAMAVIA
ncbi:MAG: tRNA preQ1(34) S-adenosylmethionine ribosyltransferase-isomerase QueA [Desulfobacterales bacterium]|nr:tRNA preQ1(34) S-adenosylmethionine ribosyltransferase-isomerase QueA [Desulfobacterales bacterium]